MDAEAADGEIKGEGIHDGDDMMKIEGRKGRRCGQ